MDSIGYRVDLPAGIIEDLQNSGFGVAHPRAKLLERLSFDKNEISIALSYPQNRTRFLVASKLRLSLEKFNVMLFAASDISSTTA